MVTFCFATTHTYNVRLSKNLRRIFPRPGDCSELNIVSSGRSFPKGLPNSFSFSVSDNGSGQNRLQSNKLNVYDKNNLLMINDIDLTSVFIYDIKGHKVYENLNIKGSNINVKILNFNSGIYIIKTKNSLGKISTKKIFIK